MTSLLGLRTRAAAICLLVVALLGSGCSADAGIDANRLPEWTVESDPSVAIGGSDERLDYIVYGVVGATRLTDGRLVVASQRASQIKVFSPAGEHVRTVGGVGRGPGEFEGIMGAYPLAGDSLLVVSRSPGLTWLSPEGEYVRSLPVGIWGLARHPCRISESAFHSLGDGRLVTTFDDNAGLPGCLPLVEGTHRYTTLVELQDHPGERFDTVAVLPGTERNGMYYRVFGGLTLLSSMNGRIYMADSRSDSIRVWQRSGDIDVWPIPVGAAPVPSAAREVSVQRWTGDDGREVIREYRYPDSYPAMGRLLADRTGALWVMRYPQDGERIESIDLTIPYRFRVEHGGARWIVLDETGTPIAAVRTPDGLYPMEIGADYVLGITMDEYDVETVQLHQLER